MIIRQKVWGVFFYRELMLVASACCITQILSARGCKAMANGPRASTCTGRTLLPGKCIHVSCGVAFGEVQREDRIAAVVIIVAAFLLFSFFDRGCWKKLGLQWRTKQYLERLRLRRSHHRLNQQNWQQSSNGQRMGTFSVVEGSSEEWSSDSDDGNGASNSRLRTAVF